MKQLQLLFVFVVVFALWQCSSTSEQEVAKHTQFVKIHEGTYTVGQKKHPYNPLKTIHLKTYYIASKEVTNEAFAKFVKATGYVTDAERLKNAQIFYPGLREYVWKEDSTACWKYPGGKKNGGIKDRLQHPVTTISFSDALVYCNWANVRLPTLEEWEVACRANSDTRYFWGDAPAKIHRYANVWRSPTHQKVEAKERYLYTAPVGSYQPNPWGLYDVYGNVFEFCSGVPKRLQKYKYLICSRGGSWWCSRHSCNFFNSLDIGSTHRNASFSNQGFRVVKNKEE